MMKWTVPTTRNDKGHSAVCDFSLTIQFSLSLSPYFSLCLYTSFLSFVVCNVGVLSLVLPLSLSLSL